MPRKNYYAFVAFKALLDTPARVQCSGGEPGTLAKRPESAASTTR